MVHPVYYHLKTQQWESNRRVETPSHLVPQTSFSSKECRLAGFEGPGVDALLAQVGGEVLRVRTS